MSDADDRFDVLILGRKIGTTDGWDGAGEHILHFYNFISTTPMLEAPPGAGICIDFETGDIEIYDAEGEPISKSDALDIIRDLPRGGRDNTDQS